MNLTRKNQRIAAVHAARARRWARQWRLTKSAVSIALVCLPVLAFVGCSHSGPSSASPVAATQSYPAGLSEPSLFKVPNGQMQHLRIVNVESSTLPQVFRLPGSVAYNDFQTTSVITQVSGPVTRVLAYPGQTVRAGQPLLDVRSPDYIQMRSSYIKARDNFNLAEKNYRRSHDLYAHEAVSASALEQAQSTANQAQADLTAAAQALRVLGVSNPDQAIRTGAAPEIPLLAPISGEVVSRTVSPGQVIQGGATQCFTISNLSTVWVLASVPQGYLAYVHQGDLVTIHTDAYPQVFQGRISYLAAAMDPATRTLQVRIVTENPGHKLKKDMYVTVLVNARAIKNALTVPDAAVLRNSENQPFVYVVVTPGQFAQRLITIGDTQEGRTRVLNGLRAGEKVVADGSLFLQFANSFQH
ncbi:MAG: efflux RND transporter periplasmic adaptor subunit [Terriglobia bacterium]